MPLGGSKETGGVGKGLSWALSCFLKCSKFSFCSSCRESVIQVWCRSKLNVFYNIYIRSLHTGSCSDYLDSKWTHLEKQMWLTVMHSIYMLCAQNALEWM